MYGFRYHLVTVISIFMALGTGILLGGSMGEDLFSRQQRALFDQLEEKYNLTRAENVKWNKKASDLTKHASQFDQILREASLPYIKGRLAGKKIALVQLEKGDTAGLNLFLQMAGAQIQSITFLKDTQSLLEGSKLPAVANRTELIPRANSSPVIRSAKEIALMVAGGTSTDWLSLMKRKGWIETAGDQSQRPDAIIVIGGSSKFTQPRLQEFDLPFLKETARQKIRVIGTERSDVEFSGIPVYNKVGLSTVDNIDQFVGQLSLLELLRGKHGNYGVKPSADHLAPAPDSLLPAQEVR